MGLDFITTKAKAFKKAWNGAMVALAEPDLFSPDEEWGEQHVLFDVHDGCIVIEGEELVVQVASGSLVALRGQQAVATAGNPPATIVMAISRAHGYVLGRVARYSVVSRTADLAFRVK